MRVRLNRERLLGFLAQSRLSQNHWALKLGLSRGHWSEIVNGKHSYPSPRTRERMLEVLRLPFDELFEIEAGTPATPETDFRGAIADRYLIDHELAQGGMGAVYLARDGRHGRVVAVKVVSPEAVSGIGVTPFLREISMVAKLQHPHILPLYDSGEAAGHPFYVMPYIRGGSLRARLEAKIRLSVEDVSRLTTGIAAALEHAHAQRILHCDVKPENILLDGDHPYVMDFGIARKLHAEVLPWAARQELDFTAGTPAYVSPEQAGGERELDARSDVYSLACVVYEMLTGRRPFEGTTTDAVVARRFVSPAPAIRDFAPEVPPAVESAVERAMALEPSRRPATATAFAASIAAGTTNASGVLSRISIAVTRALSSRRRPGRHAIRLRPLLLESLAADVRYALRQLRRAPAFAATAIITLALGIGANATMFGVIDRLLLQPPAGVTDPGTVVIAAVTRTFTGAGQAAVRDTQAWMSYPLYADLVRTGAFEQVAAYRLRTLTLGSGVVARLVRGMATTAGFFPALRVRPAVGRFYSEAEADEAPGAEVVVLSHAFWRREFGGDPRAVGQSIELSGRPFLVVGVAPSGFTGVDRAPVDLWIPLTAGVTAEGLARWKQGRESFFLSVFARLKRGTPIGTAAQQGSAGVRAGYLADGTSASDVERQQPGVALVSALPRDAHGNTAEGRVALLLGAVALLVLVLACANVANLQLARTIQRRRELAVRLALGVARGRLLRQLALDSVLLALLGGIAALAIAYAGGEIGRRALVRFGLGDQPLVDARVLAFTALISTLTGLATGFIPALQTTRLELTHWLRSGAREGGGRSSRARLSLLVLQASLTVVLLSGTGMFVVSLHRVQSVRLGLEPDQVFRATVVTAGRAYTEAERRTMYEQLLRTAVGTPGVESAALATSLPFESSSGTSIILPGRDSVPTTREGGPYDNTVTPEFFRTIGTRLIVGRSFTDADRAGSAPVVIVNQTAARLWWPGESAIGKCIKIGADSMPCAEVVGVVENAKRFRIVEDESVQIYAPIEQLPSEGVPNVLYVRPVRNTSTFQAQLQRQLQSADPALPYVSVQPLSDIIAPRMESWRVGATMFGIFAALAVVLASVGLYGVLTYDVGQRQRELGVRLALGASRGSVAGLLLRRTFVVVTTGSAIGLAATLAGGRIVGPMLFRTSPADPLILSVVVLVVLLVSVVATVVPTARAMRVDPAFALRGE